MVCQTHTHTPPPYSPHHTPFPQVVGLLKIFKEMDTDDNGVLTLAELSAAFQKKGVLSAPEHAQVRTQPLRIQPALPTQLRQAQQQPSRPYWLILLLLAPEHAQVRIQPLRIQPMPLQAAFAPCPWTELGQPQQHLAPCLASPPSLKPLSGRL